MPSCKRVGLPALLFAHIGVLLLFMAGSASATGHRDAPATAFDADADAVDNGLWTLLDGDRVVNVTPDVFRQGLQATQPLTFTSSPSAPYDRAVRWSFGQSETLILVNPGSRITFTPSPDAAQPLDVFQLQYGGATFIPLRIDPQHAPLVAIDGGTGQTSARLTIDLSKTLEVWADRARRRVAVRAGEEGSAIQTWQGGIARTLQSTVPIPPSGIVTVNTASFQPDFRIALQPDRGVSDFPFNVRPDNRAAFKLLDGIITAVSPNLRRTIPLPALNDTETRAATNALATYALRRDGAVNIVTRNQAQFQFGGSKSKFMVDVNNGGAAVTFTGKDSQTPALIWYADDLLVRPVGKTETQIRLEGRGASISASGALEVSATPTFLSVRNLGSSPGTAEPWPPGWSDELERELIFNMELEQDMNRSIYEQAIARGEANPALTPALQSNGGTYAWVLFDKKVAALGWDKLRGASLVEVPPSAAMRISATSGPEIIGAIEVDPNQPGPSPRVVDYIKTSIGISYRSGVSLQFDQDDLPFIPPPGLPRPPHPDAIPLPDLVMSGVAFRPSEKLDTEGDVSWVNWTDFDALQSDYQILQQVSGRTFQLELSSSTGSFLVDAAEGTRMQFRVPASSPGPAQIRVFQGQVLAVPRTPESRGLDIVIPGSPVRLPVGAGVEVSAAPNSLFINPLGWSVAPELRRTMNSTAWQNGFTFRLGGDYTVTDTAVQRLGGLFDPTVIPDETLKPLLPQSAESRPKSSAGDVDISYMFVKLPEREAAPSVDEFDASYQGRAHLFGATLSFGSAGPATGATITTAGATVGAPFAVTPGSTVPGGSTGGGGGAGSATTVPSFFPIGLSSNIGVNAAGTTFFIADQFDWFNSSVSFRRAGEASFTSCATACYSNGTYSEVLEANNLAVGIVSGGSGTLFGNPFPATFLVGTGTPMQTAQLGSANALLTFTVAKSIALITTDANARGTVTGTFGVNFSLDKVGANLNVAISGLNLTVSTPGGAANPATSNVNVNRGGPVGTFGGFTAGSFNGTLSGFWNAAGNGMTFTGNITRPAGNVTYGGIATR